MTAAENILTQLDRLCEHGGMPRSQCSGSLLKMLCPMLDSGVVVEERSGAGRRLVVHDGTALREFRKLRFPEANVPGATPSRVAGVARFRDSKAGASDTPDTLILRAWSDTALWHKGQPVPTAQATAAHGVFSFVLTPSCSYELRAPCALVENPAVLLGFERLRQDIPLALYGGGRISGRVRAWLAGQSAPGFRLIHFPDYDPVGMSEHLRLRTLLGDRVSLHLPGDLAAQFTRFGNPELMRRPASQALLPKLRNSDLAEVKFVLELMDRHNAGLEQEALLIKFDV